MWPVAHWVFCYTDALSFRVEQEIEMSVIMNRYSTTGHHHAPIDNITIICTSGASRYINNDMKFTNTVYVVLFIHPYV